MRSILILINKYFWKGWIGPIFAYFVPMILVLFIGRIMGAALVVPGIFIISPLCILLVFMPQSIFEFKNSSLLKRIGTTPIKPYKFLLGISIFNLIIVTTSFLLIFIFCFIVFADNLHHDTIYSIPGLDRNYIEMSFISIIQNADWGSFFYFLFLIVIMATMIGLLMSSFAKSTLFIQCVGISLMLVTLFVGPCILAISLVGSVEVVKILGYLIPLKYTISAAIESFTSGTENSIVNLVSSSPWNISDHYYVLNVMLLKELSNLQTINENATIDVFSKGDKLANLIMPWIFIVIFAYFTAVTFQWNNRGKTKYRWRVVSDLINSCKQNRFLNFNKNENTNVDLSSPNILEINDLTKVFKTRTGDLIANNHISFNVKRNRNLAILGHNGAGKTVLVETIVGITRQDSGTIKYNFPFKKTFNECIGIQFQDSSYPFGIKVKDIIMFFIKAYKLSISEKELEELLRKFGVDIFFNKNAGSLSGGQQQRVNLLLSVLHRPKILFLDELSTGLDIKIRNEIKTFIKDYAKQYNMSIIIISHDMNEVEYLADDILVLKDGQVKYFDSKENILKNNKSLENFIYKYL